MIDVRVPDEQEGTKAVVRAWLKKVGERGRGQRSAGRARNRQGDPGSAVAGGGGAERDLAGYDDEAVPGAVLGRIEALRAEAPDTRRAGSPRSARREAARPGPGLRRGTVGRNSPVPVGQAGCPAAMDRSRAADRDRARRADHARRCRPAVAAARPSALASMRPRSRALAGGDIPHDRMRLKIAENMVGAVSEAPHVTALFEADFSAIAAHKKALAEREGVKLSYTAYIVKAAAEAMAVPRRSTAAGKRTGSRSRRPSTSASAPRSATRAWWCRWSRTPAR